MCVIDPRTWELKSSGWGERRRSSRSNAAVVAIGVVVRSREPAERSDGRCSPGRARQTGRDGTWRTEVLPVCAVSLIAVLTRWSARAHAHNKHIHRIRLAANCISCRRLVVVIAAAATSASSEGYRTDTDDSI